MDKMFYVYILHCADGSYYTGQTDDIYRRLQVHSDPACKESGSLGLILHLRLSSLGLG